MAFTENIKMKDNLEKMVTGKELADLLGISFWAIWKWTKEGEIPFIRVRKRIFYRVSTIEKWLAEMEQASVKTEVDKLEYGVLRKVGK